MSFVENTIFFKFGCFLVQKFSTEDKCAHVNLLKAAFDKLTSNLCLMLPPEQTLYRVKADKIQFHKRCVFCIDERCAQRLKATFPKLHFLSFDQGIFCFRTRTYCKLNEHRQLFIKLRSSFIISKLECCH